MKISTVILVIGAAGAAYVLYKRGSFSRFGKHLKNPLAGTVGEGPLIDATSWGVRPSSHDTPISNNPSQDVS